MKKSILTILLIFCSILKILATESDLSADYTALSEQERMQVFNDNKAEVFQRQFLDHGKDKGVMQAIYEDNVIYDVYRGTGEIVKLSTLVDEMGNHAFAKNLRFGEAYYGFLGGFIGCTATTGTLLILGIAFTIFRNGLDFTKYEYGVTEELNEYMISAIAMFSVSAVTLAGSIVLGVYLYKSSKYKMNIIQAQSLVKQYNKFLQKKLGILTNVDMTFYKNHIDFAIKLPL